MVNYFYDCYQILNKVYSEKAFIKQAILSTFIEEKNRPLTIKTCYGVLDKDIELNYYISVLTNKTPKLVIRTILKIAMYNIKYLEKHDYAVTKNAVELTKKLGKGGISGFVNAFLRKFVSKDISLPEEKLENASIIYSYPLFAVKLLEKTYGLNRTIKIISAQNDYKTLCFYKIDGDKYLSNLNINYIKSPYDNVFFVKNFVRNADYDLGKYTYQAIGSVAICEGIEPCDNLYDCCSAPGGKSIRLSYKCKNILASDLHVHRVKLIEEYIKRMGVNNITTCVKDSKIFDKDLFERFDGVLCDAPCSSLGVMNDNPDIKLGLTEQNINSLNNEQLQILSNVSKYVKKGGYLYYSTCSVLNSENIDIVENFLLNHSDFEIINSDSKIPHENIKGTLQFLPDISFGLGFYFAKLKRK